MAFDTKAPRTIADLATPPYSPEPASCAASADGKREPSPERDPSRSGGQNKNPSPEPDPSAALAEGPADRGSDFKATPRAASDIDETIGRLVRRRRRAAGITLPELAKLIGLSYQQVHKYENGTNRISAGTLYQIAGVLGCDIAALFPSRELPDMPTDPVTRLSAVKLELSDILKDIDAAAAAVGKVS